MSIPLTCSCSLDGRQRGNNNLPADSGKWVMKLRVLQPHAERRTATVDDFDRLMATNARSVFLCYKHAGKQMIAQGRGGRIIGAKISHRSPWPVLM